MTTKVSSKGQIVLPADIRKQDDIRTGQEFEVQRLGRGKYHLQRKAKPTSQGLVDWLLDCPDKGYFVPIESESTDTL
ncbi:MAG: AbrB/MazE/SpoVT family DNA-binding domain-containing protein [Gemmatales bacterium]